MLNVGLTGGIATGKSTVVRLLASKGARVVDHDRIVRDLQEPGRPVWRKIVEAFGRDMLDASGRIDRRKLGEAVFGSPERRRELEGIVHPAVIDEWQAELRRIERAQPDAVVLSDVPLLFEACLQDRVDLVLLVYAPPGVQKERLRKRDGFTAAEAEARLSAQMPIDEKARYADIVIRNDGTAQELIHRVDEVWEELLRREKAKRATDEGEPEKGKGY